MKKIKLQKGFTLIEGMVAIAVLAILAVIAIPVYKDYVARSQVAEGFSLLSGAKIDVEEYAALYNKFSKDALKNIGIHTDLVNSIEMNDKGKITALFTLKAAKGIANEKLFLTPTIKDNDMKNIVWSCTGTMKAKYLPSVCGPVKDEEEGGEVVPPTGPVLGTFEYGNNYKTDGQFIGTYKDGKFYFGNQEYDSEYIGLKYIDENGNYVYYFKGNSDFIVNPDGTMTLLNPDKDTRGEYSKTAINYPNNLGGGLLSTVDGTFLKNNPSTSQYYIGEIPAMGQISSNQTPNEIGNNYQNRGDYGYNWKDSINGATAWASLVEASNNMALLYQNPKNYSYTSTAQQRIDSYNNAMSNFKKEIDALKAINGGNFPKDFPKIYQDVYNKY